jgi:hypothetical protein
MSSFGYELEHFERIRRCARTWRRGYRRWGGIGLTDGSKIGRTSSQMPRSLTSDCIDLAVSRAGRRKGVGGGTSRVFIGGGFLAKGARVARREVMDGQGGEERCGLPFRVKRCWAGAEFGAGPEWFPWPIFLFSLFLSLFLFLVFYFIQIFFKYDSN